MLIFSADIFHYLSKKDRSFRYLALDKTNVNVDI